MLLYSEKKNSSDYHYHHMYIQIGKTHSYFSYFFQFCNLEVPIAFIVKAKSPFTCVTILQIFLSIRILHAKNPQTFCTSCQFPQEKENHSACLLFYVQTYFTEVNGDWMAALVFSS